MRGGPERHRRSPCSRSCAPVRGLQSMPLHMGTDATTAAPRRADRPRRRVGAWRIETEIGRGGMASVYAVTHKEFGKRAALKLAHRTIASEPNAAQAFLREAR